MLGRDEFASEFRDRHAAQRAAEREMVPQIAPRIGNHADLRAGERLGDDRQAALAEHRARPQHVPGAQGHGAGADAQHRAGTLAEHQRARRPDLDAQGPAQEKSLTDRGIQMARGMVPYGGVVRFVTGANKKDQELREAILAGYARRGYLRGLQANMTCAPEAPAAPEMAPPKVRGATKRKSR